MTGIERIGNVYYRAPDMDAAVDFYTRILGLTLKFRDGDRWAAFDVGGVTLAVEGTTTTPLSGVATVSFRVDDLQDFIAVLRGRGATVADPTVGAHERRSVILDPSGNELVLYEPLPRT